MNEQTTWGPDAIRSMQGMAGCEKIGCRLVYFGEMQTEPAHLFRHEAYPDGGVVGGDIKIDNYIFHRAPSAEIEAVVVKRLKQHHEAARVAGLIPWSAA